MEPRTGSRVFAMVAGEDSGDLLGAELIEALRTNHPAAKFVGVGGPRMIAAGLESWHPLERLSVMGLVEVLRHLPGLLAIRRDVLEKMGGFDASIEFYGEDIDIAKRAGKYGKVLFSPRFVMPTSGRRMKLDPSWHCRAKYSDGFIDSWTPCPKIASWEPLAPPAPERRPA